MVGGGGPEVSFDFVSTKSFPWAIYTILQKSEAAVCYFAEKTWRRFDGGKLPKFYRFSRFDPRDLQDSWDSWWIALR